LLYIIVQQVPFKPNVTQLAAKGNIHRNSLLNYLQYLDQARLIKLLYPSGISVAGLQKPEKIYLDNTNLLYAFEGITPEIGTVRETFFQNQVRVKYPISEPKKGDFLVDHKYTFEVGGKGKGWAQVSDIENTWVVKDDREYPVANELPLWLFGFLY
jgi:predicted AAA+ superfamily ATPase